MQTITNKGMHAGTNWIGFLAGEYSIDLGNVFIRSEGIFGVGSCLNMCNTVTIGLLVKTILGFTAYNGTLDAQNPVVEYNVSLMPVTLGYRAGAYVIIPFFFDIKILLACLTNDKTFDFAIGNTTSDWAKELSHPYLTIYLEIYRTMKGQKKYVDDSIGNNLN